MENTREAVIAIIAEKTGREISDLVPGMSFKEDLQIDSLDLYEIQLEAEKVFNITINEETASTLTSIGLLIDYIEGKIK